MDDAIRAGAALWDGDAYRAARTAWTADDGDTGADEGSSASSDAEVPANADPLRRGLAALAAATLLARESAAAATADAGTESEAEAGATAVSERAERAVAALADASDASGIAVGAAQSFAAALADDPADPPAPPTLTRAPSERGFETVARAAATLADVDARYDETTVERAVSYAREEVADDTATRSRFTALVFDFVDDPDHRGLIHRRLAQHVERRARRERDVEGLF